MSNRKQWWETTEEAEFTMSTDNQELIHDHDDHSVQEFYTLVGRHSGLDFMTQVGHVAVISTYKKLKESGIWKNQKIHTDHGAVILTSWDLVCEHIFKKSKSYVNEQIQNLNIFGEALIEATESAGVGISILRLARKLEPEKLEHIREEVAQCKKPTEVKKLFEETVTELQRQLDEQKDNSEQIQNDLEQRIEHEKALTAKWNAKFRIAQKDKENKYSKDWHPAIARVRYLSAYASEQCRIALHGMYGLVNDIQALQAQEDISSDDYQAGLDAVVLIAETMLAECTSLSRHLTQRIPGIELANQSETLFKYTDDEEARLRDLRRVLQNNAKSALKADNAKILKGQTGPQPEIEDE
ncbi:hypothetical protein QF117_10585 [Vibrio sp. YMD68]|uniref:hypothetical protein n=1 Tax=Vibrio sp. YMD68 TaxID=3042300 RepID=UPI00249C8424|nr:hypothetical protein [Vibrio sp. YMD68]WGV98837.1 hypothetical protein QF117_02425 [Vibrio sp. YMD68]WGW01236.1 hypothetical protein QF117_10585 [Vibrio sp. YMD68]